MYFLKVFFPPKALSKMALYVQLTSRNATGPNLQNVALHSLCLSKEEPGDRGGAEAPSNPAEGKDRRSLRPGPDFIRSHCKFYLKLRRIHLFRKLCPHFSKKGKSRALIFFLQRVGGGGAPRRPKRPSRVALSPSAGRGWHRRRQASFLTAPRPNPGPPPPRLAPGKYSATPLAT